MKDNQRRDRLWRLVASRAGRRHLAGWAGVVCEVAVEQVDVDAAAISVRTTSRAQELIATSDGWAQRLEELQYTVGEGPGIEAFTTSSPVLVADLATAEGRWPGFADAVTTTGTGAVFAFPLHGGTIRLGTLDLYRRQPGELSPLGLADATDLAELATTALLTDANHREAAVPAGWAQEDAPGHYEDVSVATGMLAAQLHISVENALLRLRSYAFSHNRPLLEVARDVRRRQLHFGPLQD